jgi:galactosylceramidase
MTRSTRAAAGLTRRQHLLAGVALAGHWLLPRPAAARGADGAIRLRPHPRDKRFDGIGVVNGGGATSVLLKDYPEPQRSQILDLLYKPQFGASVSALLVEIPGDGNATQGSMPSHMHSRDDLDHHRGYIWWLLREAKRRNPDLSLDGTAWSAPGWIGDAGGWFPKDHDYGDAAFFSADMIDYYVAWLEGLRRVHGLEFDAIGVRNEKGVSYAFAKAFRKALDTRGFARVKLHGFDNWPEWKLDFVPAMVADPELRDAIDIISAHTFSNFKATPEVRAAAAAMGKPIWNTEDHVYLKGFDCAIGIVQCFNHNYIRNGATRIVNWYDIAALYAMEPYSEDPAALIAHEPWSGHYRVREALWGYAHYGQFSQIGWTYLDSGCGELPAGGSHVALKSADGDYSLIIETKGATGPQRLRFDLGKGLSRKALCQWRSNAAAQFVQGPDVQPVDGRIDLLLEPDSIYSLSTRRGQRKGGFDAVPAPAPFPFPYRDSFTGYAAPARRGYLPAYTADIAGAFEIAPGPSGQAACLRQMAPVPTLSWAPDWQPYTILGDVGWRDYHVACDIWIGPGERAGLMGRINHVGTGYGFIPKGYYLEVQDGGLCRLIAIRGKKDRKALVGDAEQQALIRKAGGGGEGGELLLGSATVPGVGAGRWHRLALHFEGQTIRALIDGQVVLRASDPLYGAGMVGLLAGQTRTAISRPWYRNLTVDPLTPGAGTPPPRPPAPPLYPDA